MHQKKASKLTCHMISAIHLATFVLLHLYEVPLLYFHGKYLICGSLRIKKHNMQNSIEPMYTPTRKQSSGDLQSRLKTRKLLGVGESEDGSVPMSKISQILGNDDHFLLAFPAGLRLWQVTTSFVFTAVALMAIIFPSKLILYSNIPECSAENNYPIMFFGASLACLAVLFWSAVYSPSRHVIRWTLVAQILYFALQTIVFISMIWEINTFSFLNVVIVVFHVLLTTISLLYYLRIIGYRFSTGRRIPYENCDKAD
ncbi:tumor protein p53-inducible protein 11-like isoform X2 [Anneissia japonica]|uniref:tumor protein p53-inducible protein 11-like isoform X2 n=1 Tax=Anneissia japonica TaxID=1529436 RepID=UPI0014256B53|nr:tumor protein p53-inducible protein 11-like isoform X2 [Anneissia japonica]